MSEAPNRRPDRPSLGQSDLLRNRVALVTGASRGIGAAITLALAAHGTTVAVNYLRSADSARRVAEEARALGGRAEPFAADVTDAAAVERMVAEIDERFGPVNVVVNNALRDYSFDPLARRTAWEIPWEDYEAQFGGVLWAAPSTCAGRRSQGCGGEARAGS